MAKLTKKQSRELTKIVEDIQRVEAFLAKKNIVLAKESDYTGPKRSFNFYSPKPYDIKTTQFRDGTSNTQEVFKEISPINAQHGCDMVFLNVAKTKIQRFLEDYSK